MITNGIKRILHPTKLGLCAMATEKWKEINGRMVNILTIRKDKGICANCHAVWHRSGSCKGFWYVFTLGGVDMGLC
jgi:hypothetical protein